MRGDVSDIRVTRSIGGDVIADVTIRLIVEQDNEEKEKALEQIMNLLGYPNEVWVYDKAMTKADIEAWVKEKEGKE